MSSSLIAFNKPYGVVCQFRAHEKHPSLKQYIDVADVYPAGRLDADSEGLLLLTDNGAVQAQIAHPKNTVLKTYWAQVEGGPNPAALTALRRGVDLGDFVTRPARVRLPEDQEIARLWPRNSPIRVRKTVPDFWLEIQISEGKNRQVRRMCARAGLPCLRLVRVGMGTLSLFDLNLAPGQWQSVPLAAVLPSGA